MGTDEFCLQTKVAFGDPDDFGEKGGLRGMGESLKRGHVLVMSMWDDHDANMLWLDSDYPLDKDPSVPGVSRGPCPTTNNNLRRRIRGLPWRNTGVVYCWSSLVPLFRVPTRCGGVYGVLLMDLRNLA